MSKKQQAGSRKGSQGATSAGRTGMPASGGRRGLSVGARVGIAAIAIFMALSMMMPSLSSIFSSDSSGSDGGAAATQPSSSDSSTSASDPSSSASDPSSSASDSSAAPTVEAIDARYQPLMAELEGRLAGDPQNLATLLNLGRGYMRWGVSVRYSDPKDADVSHANQLLESAVGYFERYLSLNDASSVKVDIALCKFHEGDVDAAASDLEQLTTDVPDYGPAWANLGMLHEAKGDRDAALSAYHRAVEADADDEYGAKTYAKQRIAALESSGSGSTKTTPTTGSARGLSDTLSSLSGTSL